MLARCAGSAALSLAAALALTSGVPARAFAQSSAPPESAAPAVEPARELPPIRIRLVIARASEVEGAVDPGARDIYEHLPAKYHSIALIEDRTVDVNLGDQAHVWLPSGSEVRLLPVAVHGGQLHLQIEMPDVLNTSMRLANSRAFYIGGVRMGEDTMVFKLVPEFSDYVSTPSSVAGTPVPKGKTAAGRSSADK
jgi:hypothetical protein